VPERDTARPLHDLQETLIDALGEGVVIVTPDDRVVRMNPAARELLGLDAAPPTNTELRALIDVRDAGTDEPVTPTTSPVARALSGEALRSEHSLRNARTGERRRVEAVSTPVRAPSGEVVAAILLLHDVTARDEAEKQRDEFLSIVSHELKTPLTPLKAIAQLLRGRMRRSREGGRELDLDSFERNLATIERQVDRMNGIVDDLLEVSRAGRGRFELVFGEVDLVPLVRDVVQKYAVAAAEDGRHHFTVDMPESLVVRGDPARLEQVLMNLIGNAVKYSPRGGEVDVALRASDGSAIVEVRDTGIGIPAEDLERVGRQAFARGGGRAGTFPGVGIGLYISRLVAEGHGGALEVESDGDDKGTTVRIRIPVNS